MNRNSAWLGQFMPFFFLLGEDVKQQFSVSHKEKNKLWIEEDAQERSNRTSFPPTWLVMLKHLEFD